MTTRTLSDTIARRLWVAGIATAIAAALVAAMLLSSSSSPASASASQTSSTGDRKELRTDLTAARRLDGEARKAALKRIRADAAAGKYGDKIEKRIDRHADRRAAVLALLPDELQSDLKDLKAAPKDDRKAMRDDIRTKALAGGYGDKVEAAAEQLKDDWRK